MIGQTFNRLTVVSFCEKKNNHNYWWCKCNCGNSELKRVSTNNLRMGKVKSCGCLRNEKVKNACKKPNKYDLSGEYGIGFCNNTNQFGGNEFYFDLEDYDKIKDYHWLFDVDGYVVGYINNSRKIIPMHRVIMNIVEDSYLYKVVDHIYHHLNDNRKSELRIASHSQNAMNQIMKSCNSSGVKGVYYSKDRKKWCAEIGVNGKTINLGRFNLKDDAIKARKEAEEKYFGEFKYYTNPM